MTTRAEQILDAAIAVLGGQGTRELTHRAVDAAAGLPQGSTSNYFRSRDALLDGVVARVTARERDALPPSFDVDGLAAFVIAAVTERRDLTLARFALLVEAAHRPHLQEALRAASGPVSRWAVEAMRAAGSAHPERDASIVGAQVDALTLRQLAYPVPGFDPAPVLGAVLSALLAGSR